MLGHQVEKIRIGRCGLVGGSVSLSMGFEVSKSHTKPRVFLSAHRSGCGSQLLLQHLPYLLSCSCHDDNELNAFLLELPWSWSLFTATEQCLRHKQCDSKGTTPVYFKINGDDIFPITLHLSEIDRLPVPISMKYV